MTQEEKAKAYDEALKRAKFYHGNCPLEPERKKLEEMFPELADSEDERIRKEIVNFILYKSGHLLDEETEHRFVSYLEKQKEQKPASSGSSEKPNNLLWREEDEKRVKQLIYDTEAIRAGYEKRKELLGERFNNELIRDCDAQIIWLKALPERFNLQPKQEWSEEDETRLRRVLEFIDKYGTIPMSDGKVQKRFNAEYIWLKALPERFKSLRPVKQEWSEEDKETLEKLHRLLVICRG